MSAIGPKQTCALALHMSRFRGRSRHDHWPMSAFAVALGCKAKADISLDFTATC